MGMTFDEICNHLESYGCALNAVRSEGAQGYSVSICDHAPFGFVSDGRMRFYKDSRNMDIVEFGTLCSRKEIRRFKKTVHHCIGSQLIDSRGLRKGFEWLMWDLLPHPLNEIVLGIIAVLCGVYIPHGDTVAMVLFFGIMLLSVIAWPWMAVVWVVLFIIAFMYMIR